jgi:hypothetical protein
MNINDITPFVGKRTCKSRNIDYKGRNINRIYLWKWYDNNREIIDSCVWRPIPDHEGYEAGSNGYIRNAVTLKVLKPQEQLINNHYRSLTLKVRLKDGVYKRLQVSRLIALTFVENPHNYSQVQHLDNDSTNNRYTNLEWTNQSLNSKNSSHYLNGHCQKAVIQADRHKSFVKRYSSLKQACMLNEFDTYSKSRQKIAGSCNHQSRLAYGYKWYWETKCMLNNNKIEVVDIRDKKPV